MLGGAENLRGVASDGPKTLEKSESDRARPKRECGSGGVVSKGSELYTLAEVSSEIICSILLSERREEDEILGCSVCYYAWPDGTGDCAIVVSILLYATIVTGPTAASLLYSPDMPSQIQHERTASV
jgi:hypothetical protein